jgi:uncharacterized membrane protein
MADRNRIDASSVPSRVIRWLNYLEWAVVAATVLGALAVWPLAPDQVVVHWSLTGRLDGYADKLPGLFGLPLLCLLVLVGMKTLPRIDPHRARYAEFASAYAIATLAIVAFLAAVQAIVLASAIGRPVNVGLVIAPLVGVLLIVLGAVLSQVRPNWFFGIRTPWTLSSDRSWTATHRLGRWVLMAMGLAVGLAGFVQSPWAFYLAMIVCLAGTLGLVVYSFVVWRDDPQRHGV